MPIQSVMDFLREIDRLKGVTRQTLNFHEARQENSAEHSWHLAMAVLQMHNYANHQPLDLLRAVKMALIHDVVEIDAGDTFIYSDVSDKPEKELRAAERIFGLLPGDAGGELKKLWIDFEAGICAESQFVRALDRFLPMYSNILNGGFSWRAHNISSEQILAKNKSLICRGSNLLWQQIERAISKEIPNFHLSPWLNS